MADAPSKESAERSQALKANLEADIRDTELVASEQLFCFLDAAFDEVLVRRLVEGLPEKPQKVIAGETSLLRNLIEAQRMVVAVIDKITRTAKPLKRFKIY
jgi:hypothetical protein